MGGHERSAKTRLVDIYIFYQSVLIVGSTRAEDGLLRRKAALQRWDGEVAYPLAHSLSPAAA